ncbi:MAG: DegT/DnrJ/EryC1/StrS family aminotransferase [Lentisphaerae bacterium]|nr:DegT/DnrJ/EryC1/StrS family aminotransferase [Lentisphaerota bacterium]
MELGYWLGGQGTPFQPLETWPQLQGRRVIGTYRGRSAAALACRLLGVGEGQEVLFPSYNCGTELDAVLHSGARVVAYRVSRRCEIDLEDLMARKSSRTRAVYVIHYFGWEQPMAELRRWCDDSGLLLLEDCALALFSSGPSNSVGRAGDASIFSLSKTLGSWHGGLLSMSGSSVVREPNLVSPGIQTLWTEFRTSLRPLVYTGLERLRIYGPLISVRGRLRKCRDIGAQDAEFPPMPKSYYFNPDADADRSLHTRIRALAGAASPDAVLNRRRANYARLAKTIEGHPGVEALYPELPRGVCPLHFPIRVSNRDALVREFEIRGVPAIAWWKGFHLGAIDWANFAEACQLKRDILCLPVHQGLDGEHVEHICSAISDVLKTATC